MGMYGKDKTDYDFVDRNPGLVAIVITIAVGLAFVLPLLSAGH